MKDWLVVDNFVIRKLIDYMGKIFFLNIVFEDLGIKIFGSFGCFGNKYDIVG